MTLKDDGNEVISKKVLDWLNQVGGLISAISVIAAALAAIFAEFFPNLGDDAQRIAWVVAGFLLIIGVGVFFYQRRRAAKLKIAESLEPLSASAALRGLLPFEEGDQLPGRARDVQELYTLVASSAFRFGVLWGESGCGKTSLLRAGLTPKLRNEKFLPLYINKPTKDPQEAIRSALLKEVQGLDKRGEKNLKSLLKAAAPKGKKIVILFDQFEEFFLTNRTPSSRAGFVKWLGEVVKDENLSIAFLIGIRADFFAQLQNFAPQIPEPTSARSTYQLQNFDTEQAKQIFSAAAKADGIAFEPALIQAIVKELETEEFIRPAELQVVGTRLKRKNIFTLNKYEALGGARGILSSYIGDEIKQSPNEQAARLILRLMCADVVETKSQTDLSLDDILRGVSGIEQPSGEKAAGRPDEIQAILKQFVNARVLIHTDDDKYNLVHDYLAPYVRTATEGTETNVERANRLLKRYVAEFKEDPKTRIPFGRVRWIQKYATAEVRSGEKARELIKKSKGSFYGIASIPLLLITALYIFLASSYYFGIDEDKYIVILSGNPQWKIVPGFDQVVIQTDFKDSDLDSKFAHGMANGLIAGFWFQQTEAGYQIWGEQLTTSLAPISQAKALRWLGQPERSAMFLLEIVIDPAADSAVRSSAASALESLARTRPEAVTPAVTPDMLASLIEFVIDPEADSAVRSSAASALESLAQAKPEAVTPDMLASLIEFVIDSAADSNVRSSAVFAVVGLARANPEAITSQVLHTLLGIITNPQSDSDVRSIAASALESLAQAKPEAVTPDMLASLIEFVIDPEADSAVRSSAASALESLAQAKPEAVTPDMLASLIEFIIDPQSDIGVRDALDALGQLAQANPEAVTVEMLQTLFSIYTDQQSDLDMIEGAGYVLGQLAQVKPEAVTPEMLETSLRIITDQQSDDALRFSAGYTLGQLAQAKPEAVTPEMLETLLRIITDQQIDPDVRSMVGYVLGQLALAKPDEVTPEMLQTLFGIYTDPQSDPDVRSSVENVLGQLAQANPEAVTPGILQTLLDIITDLQSDPGVRSSAVFAVVGLARANPEAITSQVLHTLLSIVTNPQSNSDVRYRVGDALVQLAKAKPEAVTSQMLETLIGIITDPQSDYMVRPSAGVVLEGLAQARPEVFTSEMLLTLSSFISDSQNGFVFNSFGADRVFVQFEHANPEAVTAEMLQTLFSIYTDPQSDPDVRSSAGYVLGQLAQGKPEAVTAEMLQTLFSIYTDPQSDPDVRSSAGYVLGQLAQAKPKAVTAEMLQTLFSIYIDSQSDLDMRTSAGGMLGQLAQAKPEAVTTEMLQTLFSIYIDSQSDLDMRTSAGYVLGQLAQAKPEAVTAEIPQALLSIITDPQSDSDMRSSAVDILEQLTQTRPQLLTRDLLQSLIALLKSETDSPGRILATYALFEIGYKDAYQENIIRKELEELQASPQPHLRMTVSKALEMMAIGDLYDEAVAHPEQRDQIKSRLYYFSEDHLVYAMSIVREEIEKLEEAEKETEIK